MDGEMDRRRISEEVESEIYRLYDQGLSPHQIAEKLAICNGTANVYCSKYEK